MRSMIYAPLLAVALAAGCKGDKKSKVEPPTIKTVEKIVEKIIEKCPEQKAKKKTPNLDKLCMDLNENARKKRHHALMAYSAAECYKRERVKKDIGYGELWVKKYTNCSTQIKLERQCTAEVEHTLVELDIQGRGLHLVTQTVYSGYNPVNNKWTTVKELPEREKPFPTRTNNCG